MVVGGLKIGLAERPERLPQTGEHAPGCAPRLLIAVLQLSLRNKLPGLLSIKVAISVGQ